MGMIHPAPRRCLAAACGGVFLAAMLLLPSCGAQQTAAPDQDFQAQLTQRAAPCVGADKADPQDFVLDSVQYGHFSSPASADQVQLQFLPAKDGRDYVLYLGAVTYQDISTYDLQLFQVSGSGWEPVSANLPQPDDARPGDCAYSLADQAVLRLNGDHTYTAYMWDRETERFLESSVLP